jgi:hypothetical protein
MLTIPKKTDERRHRLRRGGHGGRPPGFDQETYRRRSMIERCFNRLKGFRGIATTYAKTATSHEAAVTLASFLRRPDRPPSPPLCEPAGRGTEMISAYEKSCQSHVHVYADRG